MVRRAIPHLSDSQAESRLVSLEREQSCVRHWIVRRSTALAIVSAIALGVSHSQLIGQEEFRFRSGVELVNVTATVTDRSGRFVSGLAQGDFTIYEDDRPVEIMHFSAERVPVSLGIVLDTSGSMAGDKIVKARSAISRFLDQLAANDEVFVYRFANNVELVQDWTTNRDAVNARVRRLNAVGGTAMYDALVEAVPVAQGGRHGKKAIVLISDGNDTNSDADTGDVRRVVRETEVLIYAIGIEGEAKPTFRAQPPTIPPGIPMPFPIPRRGRPRMPFPLLPQGSHRMGRIADRLNVAALREITDGTGGRTEIVRDAGDLDGATTSVADELSKQYYLGYSSPGHRDGLWHTIRVEVRDTALRVRARRGYVATP
jgi:Ca-activated chloride channel family protein